MKGTRWAYLWLSISALFVLSLWVTGVGRVYVQGIPSTSLEGIAEAVGLVPGGSLNLYRTFTWLPGDPVFHLSLGYALLAVLSFLFLWLTLYRVWDNYASPTLTCGMLFFGQSYLWIGGEGPGSALLTAFKAAAVGCIVSAKVPLLCGAVLGLSALEPSFGVACFLVLCYLSYKRLSSYGAFVAFTAVMGSALLMVVLIGDFVLRPSLQGLSGWTLIPLITLWRWPEIRESRKELYGVLLAASVLTGSPELATPICLGDLMVCGFRWKGKEDKSEAEGRELPLYSTQQATALLLLILIVLPGEQYLNRNILIGAQKKDIPLSQLLIPFSLHRHARLLDEQEWRQESPIAGLHSEEIALARSGVGPFRVLTPASARENREVALSYALLAHRPLRGWADREVLSTSSMVCRTLEDNVLVDAEPILFRRGSDSRVVASRPPIENISKLPPLDIRAVWSIPFETQLVSELPGAAYQLKTRTTTEVLSFPKSRAILVLSPAQEVYQIASLRDPENNRELKVGEIQLALLAPQLDEVKPSRSLIPIDFKLYNRGLSPVSTEEIDSVTLTVKKGASFEPFKQEVPVPFVLFPMEGIEVTLHLATPEGEGTYELEAHLTTIDGRRTSLDLVESAEVSTWRRLPPVGTWVEEPAGP